MTTAPSPSERVTSDAAAGWRLLDWINLFDPDGMADSRSWRWRSHGQCGPVATVSSAGLHCSREERPLRCRWCVYSPAMTNAGYGESTSSTVEEDLCAADELLARPFLEREYRGACGCGGPGFHLLVLQASRDFLDAPGEEVVQEAEADLQARLDTLEAKLVVRWGEPTDVDLRPYLQAGLEGMAVPKAIDSLCQLVGSMRVWLVPGKGRWLALTIGQGDKEPPFELIIAIGEIEALDPTGSHQERSAASVRTEISVEQPGARPLSFTARALPAAVKAFSQGEQIR